jgi:hypothetical protein
MIKEGYDHFEVTRQEPKVEFCEAKYVFDPAAPPNSSKPPVFNAAAKCPAYVIPDQIASAVKDKQRQDDVKTAELIAKGTPVATRRPDIDGGMNHIFASKVPDASTGLSDPPEPGFQNSAFARAPGTIPPTVNPPRVATSAGNEPVAAVAAAPTTRVANASASAEPGFLSSLARKVGVTGSTETTATTRPSTPPAKPKAIDATAPKLAVAPKPAEPKLAIATKPAEPKLAVAAAKPALKPSLPTNEPAPAAAGTISGAQPIVSPNSFESRFSVAR